MTYKARIRSDVDRAYATEGGPEFFDNDYINRLGTQAKQLDEWLIKLLIVQIALTAFQVIGFLGSDASISLFGVTLKQATGIKELLLGFYCFVAIAMWMVAVSRDTILAVVERLAEGPLTNFSKLAAPTFFSMKFYVPQAYEDWIFPTAANRVLFCGLVVVGVILSLAAFVFSFAVNISFIVDIYRHPTLGAWSTLVLAFVCLTILFGILFIARFHMPLPYRDQSVMLALKALEDSDPSLHRRQLAEIFGPQSTYRKYKWSYLFKMRVAQLKTGISDICATIWSSLEARRKRWRYRKSWRDRY